MSWPLENVRVIREFDPPGKPWLAGHRGVDLDAGEGTKLLAPADGKIFFAGKVAEKDVVVLMHAYGIRSTFEPATTRLEKGQKVARGQQFATRSSGKSDHCSNSCVHWGIKRISIQHSDSRAARRRITHTQYLNPSRMVKARRITIQLPQE
ncbi:M23 family metallopeptidase [Alloscardovia theropitheci]|uniref:M23 family metallopeptidase n=2 Tax=Alloscardovia theropitheci TaxID=2496842 RepID=A0A4V2MU39_9BIFI|nr:M23 family metallopeptidase [Alloscardovia theropitheci]